MGLFNSNISPSPHPSFFPFLCSFLHHRMLFKDFVNNGFRISYTRYVLQAPPAGQEPSEIYAPRINMEVTQPIHDFFLRVCLGAVRKHRRPRIARKPGAGLPDLGGQQHHQHHRQFQPALARLSASSHGWGRLVVHARLLAGSHRLDADPQMLGLDYIIEAWPRTCRP